MSNAKRGRGRPSKGKPKITPLPGCSIKGYLTPLGINTFFTLLEIDMRTRGKFAPSEFYQKSLKVSRTTVYNYQKLFKKARTVTPQESKDPEEAAECPPTPQQENKRRRQEIVQHYCATDKQTNACKIYRIIKREFPEIQACRRTVSNDVSDVGFARKKRPYGTDPGQKGGPAWCEERVKFCQELVDKHEELRHLCFVDESPVRASDGPRYEMCRKDEQPSVRRHVRGSARVMVFGAIGGGGFRFLVNLDKFVDKKTGNTKHKNYMDMLKEKFIPAITKYYNKYNEGRPESERIHPIIVQDNCPVHGPKNNQVRDLLARFGLRLLKSWPAKSPDLNVIENLWAELKRRLEEHEVFDHLKNKKSVEKLYAAAQRHMKRLSCEYTNGLVACFNRRLRKCIELKGCQLRN